MIVTVNLGEGVSTKTRVADDGFGLVANLYITGKESELLLQATLSDLSDEEYFDALGLATDLEAFADALREAVG